MKSKKIIASIIVAILLVTTYYINVKATTISQKPTLTYSVHVQNIGNMPTVTNGAIAGTTGEGKRIEAIKINITDLPNSAQLTYSVHVQNIGWMNPVKNGELAGTTGQEKRVEAIKINLTGTNNYDIIYRVHVANIGWMNWVENGEVAGTTGQEKQIEAIEILLLNGSNASDEIERLNKELSETKANLSEAITQLAETQFELNDVKEELKKAQEGLPIDANQKTVVFINGTNCLAIKKVQYGSKVTAPNVSQAGSTLKYWSTDGTEAGKVDLNNKTITSDTVLFAVLGNLTPGKVTFDFGNDKENQVVNGYVGDTVTLPTVSDTTTGNVVTKFKGWYLSTDETKTPIQSITISSTDQTYKALYEVTFKENSTPSASDITSAITEAAKLDDPTPVEIEKPYTVSENITVTGNATLQFDDIVTISDGKTLSVSDNGTINFQKDVTVSDKGTLTATEDKITKANGVTITKQVATEENNKLQTSLNNKIFDVVQLANTTDELSESSVVTINSDSDVTLDLNGKKLESTASDTNTNTIVNEGNLTIIDSSTTMRNTDATSLITSENGNVIENKGTLTIEGGTFDATKNGKSALVNDEKGIVTLNGGTFKRSTENGTSSNTYYTVTNVGTMTITGNTVLENEKSYSSLITNGYYKSSAAGDKTAKLTIEGGTFKGGKYVVKNDYAGTLNVTGGNYIAVDGTQCIFRTIGTMDLDLNGSETDSQTKAISKPTFDISAETANIKAIVLVGNHKEDTEGDNKLIVHGFDFSITGELSSNTKFKNINVDAHGSTLCSSDITVHVSDADTICTLIKDYINKAPSTGTVNEEKNKNTIVLDSDIAFESDDKIDDTIVNKLTIDLNDHGITGVTENQKVTSGADKITVKSSNGTGSITVGNTTTKYNASGKVIEN